MAQSLHHPMTQYPEEGKMSKLNQSRKALWSLCLSLALMAMAAIAVPVWAQQTSGSITGTVTDASGAVLPGVAVKVHNISTGLDAGTKTNGSGDYNVFGLPIGAYTVSFSKDGFKTETYSEIIVQANRTTTVPGALQPGTVTTTVTVTGTPLLNRVDTTNGYVLGSSVIEAIPLGTGSFTQLAILSPGVNADLLSGSGSNAGLGNQNIFANGQRDTSNSFTFNAVNANNLFNGKSSSSVSASRFVLNTGENFLPGGQIQTNTSVYDAIGQGLPTPPPETIEELRVNTSMFDASQGANSGAHIELTTKSGTNSIHGGAYEYHQSTGWNANQWFYNHFELPRPHMNRNVFGGYVGGPIKKDKLFYFVSYQGQRVADQLLGISLVAVPPDLTDDRSAQALANVANKDFGPCGGSGEPACITPGQITPQALALLQAKASNRTFFIPSAETNPTILANLQNNSRSDAIVQGPGSLFTADQVNGNIDYLFSAKDRLAGKYYFQRDPNTTPFANSQLLGFPQTMNAGSQTFSLDNTTAITPNLTWEQRFGFIRQKAYANQSQSIKPSDIGMNLLGLNLFPQISLKNADNVTFNGLSIGPASNFANAGMFQNNFEASSNLKWVRGRHAISTGFNFDYTQLNVINKNNDLASVTFNDFPGFLLGQLCGPNGASCGSQSPTELLNGASNRHYRTKQAGAYVQDDIRLSSTFTLDVGVRWDWDGPLVEENGLLTNFYSQNYSYNVASDTINNIGSVVAGNNPTFGTRGVSASTLTGRQWGFAPRIGFAYSPSSLNNVVIRAGFGMYYDRGEYFAELSPPAGGGISGPFGVTVEQPFVVPFFAPPNATFGVPFGTTAPPPPPSNLTGVAGLIPNAAQLIGNTTPYCTANNLSGCGPLVFGGYDPRNTFPYSENWTLDLQWQP